jgi:hypothetical protein
VLARFVKSLAAVLIGNAVYFLLLRPLLPASGQHVPFRFDLGILIDFWICVAAYGALELILRWLKS